MKEGSLGAKRRLRGKVSLKPRGAPQGQWKGGGAVETGSGEPKSPFVSFRCNCRTGDDGNFGSRRGSTTLHRPLLRAHGVVLEGGITLEA